MLAGLMPNFSSLDELFAGKFRIEALIGTIKKRKKRFVIAALLFRTHLTAATIEAMGVDEQHQRKVCTWRKEKPTHQLVLPRSVLEAF